MDIGTLVTVVTTIAGATWLLAAKLNAVQTRLAVLEQKVETLMESPKRLRRIK